MSVLKVKDLVSFNVVSKVLLCNGYEITCTVVMKEGSDTLIDHYKIVFDGDEMPDVTNYTVKYLDYNGATIGKFTITEGEKHTVKEDAYFDDISGDTVNTFDHWACSNGDTYTGGESITINGNITFTAVASEDDNTGEDPTQTSTVKYIYNGSVIGISTEEFGTKHTVKEWSNFGVTGADNITFNYWIGSDGNTYSGGETVTINGDITFTANYTGETETRTYMVEYKYNGDSIGLSMIDGGKTHTIREWSSFAVADTENVTFNYWTGSDGNTYTGGETVTITSDLTLTANYTSNAPTYTQTYLNTDGSVITSGSGEEGTWFNVRTPSSTTLTLASGEIFNHWWCSNGNTYTGGEQITITEDLIFIACITGRLVNHAITAHDDPNSPDPYALSVITGFNSGQTWNYVVRVADQFASTHKEYYPTITNDDVVVVYFGMGCVGYVTDGNGRKITYGEPIMNMTYHAYYFGHWGETPPED